MRNSNIETLVIPLGINFRYLFGLLEEPSERLLVGIIKTEGSPKLLVPSFELDRLKKMTGISECIGWEETQDPFFILSELLHHKDGKKIGIDPKMWFSVYDRIARGIPAHDLIPAEELIYSLRAVKDEQEQELILKASQISADMIVEALGELKIGISEVEVQSILKQKLHGGSNEKEFALVQFGENSALPHYHGGTKKLQKDDVVLIDAGRSIDNYWGDITITSVFGKASKRFKEIFDIVYSANEKAKEAANRKKLPAEIDESARNYITNKGYGEYFSHRTGHGIGLEVHEHPYIVGNNRKPLNSGNVFTIEPGIYLPGQFGVRIEDNVVFTSSGIQTSKIPRYELLES
jgi:Xaa-Pro aminopeptidase